MSRPWKHIDEQKWQKLFEDYRQGLNSFLCGKKYGMSQTTVVRRLRKEGLMRSVRDAALFRIARMYANGEHGARWNGGRFKVSTGYIHVHLGGTKHRLEHVVIAEKILGRRLHKGELLHHLNGDKTDNRPENLILCNNSIHRQFHEKMCQMYMREHFRGKGNDGENKLFVRGILSLSLINLRRMITEHDIENLWRKIA
jgi:hypothetical protein